MHLDGVLGTELAALCIADKYATIGTTSLDPTSNF